MPTVRQATIDLFRQHGLNTWFGNPGSTELTLLDEFPSDFRYLLGLQEMVPVGMADGFAQVTGRPALVNLHTAPGLGVALSHLSAVGAGLGFGLPAAVGAQLGAPDRPVIALMGDGSMHYAITSLWTAAHYKIPLTIVVASNDEYGVLKQFADIESAIGIPGLDLPELNIATTAASYGIDAHEATDTDQVAEMLRAGVGDRERPTLINVRTNKVKKVAPRLT